MQLCRLATQHCHVFQVIKAGPHMHMSSALQLIRQQCCCKKPTWKLLKLQKQLPESGHQRLLHPCRPARLQLSMRQAEPLSSCERPTMAHHSNVALSMAAALLLFQLRARRYLSNVLWTHQAAR